jgi:hypothetical protein
VALFYHSSRISCPTTTESFENEVQPPIKKARLISSASFDWGTRGNDQNPPLLTNKNPLTCLEKQHKERVQAKQDPNNQEKTLLILVVDDSVVQRKLSEFKLTGMPSSSPSSASSMIISVSNLLLGTFNGTAWEVLTIENGEAALRVREYIENLSLFILTLSIVLLVAM